MQGCLRLSSVSAGGSEFVYALLGPGSYFGVGSMLRGKGPPTDVHAAGPTVLGVLDGAKVLALFDERPRLWRHVAVLLYTRLTLALMVLRDVSVAPLKQRVTRRL